MNDVNDIAIAHWGEHCNGGAERVAWEMQRTFDRPLYVGNRDPDIEPDDVTTVRGLFDGRLTEWAINRGGFPRAASYFLNWSVTPNAGHVIDELGQYDTIVTSGNETLFYVGPDTQTRIHYVHHTSRRHTDLLGWWPNTWRGTVGRTYAFVIRKLIEDETTRPDLFLANSPVVARRVHTYWGVPEDKIRVVYPPLKTHTYGPDYADTGDYYVTLGRLDNWHKHIDEIIEAFNGTDRRLKIAGSGPDGDELRELAADNIEFLGYVSEAEKRELLAGARAFVFAGRQEDFGISPAEALASGTPLLGVREGMTQHQVVDGCNGYTWNRGDLEAVLRRFEDEGVSWSEPAIAEFAHKNWSVSEFRDQMRAAVAAAKERAEVTVDLDYPTGSHDQPELDTVTLTDGGDQ